MKTIKGDGELKNARPVAVGVMTSMVVYLALLAAISALAVRGVISEQMLGLSIRAAVLISTLVGTATVLKEGEGLIAAACPAIFCLTVLLAGFLAGNGLNGEHAAKLVLPAALGAAAAFMTKRSTKGRQPRGSVRRKVNIKRKTQT